MGWLANETVAAAGRGLSEPMDAVAVASRVADGAAATGWYWGRRAADTVALLEACSDRAGLAGTSLNKHIYITQASVVRQKSSKDRTLQKTKYQTHPPLPAMFMSDRQVRRLTDVHVRRTMASSHRPC